MNTVVTRSAPPGVSLQELLQGLYAREFELAPDYAQAYLLEHASPRGVANQIDTFHWYRPCLPPPGGVVLDWGCYHAPDSCMLRAWFGDRLRLHSCDMGARDRFRTFHDFARTTYTELADEVELPYATNMFDAVIGSGVLEHTAMDDESLRELRRVLKPGGVLILSYLPNRLSVKEWWRRVVRGSGYHYRTYGLAEAQTLLKRRGLLPVEASYHSFLWERAVASVGLSHRKGLVTLLRRALPIQAFQGGLSFIARKVPMM